MFNVVGAALWVGVWACAGYFSGMPVNAIYHATTRYELYVAVAAVLLLTTLIIRRVRAAHHIREGKAVPSRCVDT